MRLRIYAPDGSPSIPASTGSSRLGGELVVGDHGWVEQGRINGRASRAAEKARKAPEKAT